MNSEKRELYLHSFMCTIGGYFGGYAVLSRMGNLGSAQTCNMIELVCTLLGENYHEFFLRLAGFFLYVSAILIALVLSKKTSVNTKRYAISIDMLGMIVLCMIPAEADIVVGILPIFFMMATQWTVFHGNGTYNSSTIFSTNNLKQFTLSMGEYVMDKKPEQLERAKFFGNSLLWYHIGVVLAFFACKAFALWASLCALPIAAVAMLLTFPQIFCHAKTEPLSQ